MATLTSEQQAALEQFEADAEAATAADKANSESKTALLQAQQKSIDDAASAVSSYAKAVESARKFVELMIPHREENPPTFRPNSAAAIAAKK